MGYFVAFVSNLYVGLLNLYFRQNSTSDRPRYLGFRTRILFTYLIIQEYGNLTCLVKLRSTLPLAVEHVFAAF